MFLYGRFWIDISRRVCLNDLINSEQILGGKLFGFCFFGDKIVSELQRKKKKKNCMFQSSKNFCREKKLTRVFVVPQQWFQRICGPRPDWSLWYFRRKPFPPKAAQSRAAWWGWWADRDQPHCPEHHQHRGHAQREAGEEPAQALLILHSHLLRGEQNYNYRIFLIKIFAVNF